MGIFPGWGWVFGWRCEGSDGGLGGGEMLKFNSGASVPSEVMDVVDVRFSSSCSVELEMGFQEGCN